jgi:hypothetical protein
MFSFLTAEYELFIILLASVWEMKILPILLFILFLFPLTNCNNYFYKAVNRANSRAAYQLSYISQGSVISGNINLQGATNVYSVNIYDSAYGNNKIQSLTLSGSSAFASNAVPRSGNYRVEVTPNSPDSPMFYFQIQLYVDKEIQGSYADVARYNILFLIYLNQAITRNINIQIPSQFLQDGTVSVYGPSLSINYNLPLIASNIGNSLNFIS